MTLGTSRVRKYRTALVAGGIATVVLAGAGTAMAVASSTPDVQHVSYLGLNFTVPASWTVTNLTAGSTTCVRYDKHVVYLGTPGTTENCPANVIGRTEALLVQPSTAGGTTAVDDTVSDQINVTTPTAAITATYGDDKAAVTDVLASAGLPAATPKPTAPTRTPHALAAVAQLPITATDSTGQGFDACEAPTADVLAKWKAGGAPFSTIGIYIGGEKRGCDQPNLNASWTSTLSAAGWHFLPIWVPLQAEFNQITNAQAEGTTDADAAITSAQALGFGVGSLLYEDMEGYSAAQRGPAMAYGAAWTAELHKRGYHSGIYSSANSGMADLAHNYGGPSTPDAVWIAHYNNIASTDEAVLPAGDFALHQRAKQYASPGNTTFGGQTISIDEDFSDIALSGTPVTTPGSGLVPRAPARLLDTRSAVGVRTKTPLGPGGKLVLQVTGPNGIPASVTSMVLNVTAIAPTTTSFLSVYPDGDPLTATNLNFTKGQTVANLVTVPVIDGAITFYNRAGTVHVIADLIGYYTTAGGQTYHQVTENRALDTRSGLGAPKAALGNNTSLTFTVAGVAGIPANVSAVLLNVTSVSPSHSGYITVYPSSTTTVPTTSNLNFAAKQSISNLVTVPVVNGTVKIYNHVGTVQVLGDILGYYTPDLSAQFTPTNPAHLLDTRTGLGRAGRKGALGAGSLKLAVAGADGIPSNVTAVVLNVTAIGPTTTSYLTVYPDGRARPGITNLNFVKGQTIANLVVVPVVDGSVDLFNHLGGVSVTADVFGYYSG